MSKTLLIFGAIFVVIILYLCSSQSNKPSESFTPNITKVTSNNPPYLFPANSDANVNTVERQQSKAYQEYQANQVKLENELDEIVNNEDVDDNEESD